MTDANIELTHDAAHDDHGHLSPEAALQNAKFAMWLYIGSEIMIFSGMLVTYIIFRRFNADIVMQAKEHLSILLVSANTFLLLASSWMMVMGLREVQRGNNRGLAQWLTGTVVLGAIFVGLQVVEYAELVHHGIVLTGSSDLARYGMRFYAPTAFHGAHVIIGCLWGLWIINRAVGNKFTATRYAAVEVFGLYWHFVDVVWIILFTFIYLI
ncbi:MAG: cytochrome c oxidase subunit 3 [Phototrophicaceae bacterium]|jgi:cytochrome c oxidase subunit 3/cytochrome o ubiquinol oxidase subunit 3